MACPTGNCGGKAAKVTAAGKTGLGKTQTARGRAVSPTPISIPKNNLTRRGKNY
jgi:hypothetical protein